jgi:hypothetical protein
MLRGEFIGDSLKFKALILKRGKIRICLIVGILIAKIQTPDEHLFQAAK